MFSLFRLDPVTSVARIGQDWSNVNDGLRFNLNKTVEYYRNSVRAVPSEHLLVNILTNIGVSTKLSLERYYANVSERSRDIARVLNLTSELSRGKVKRGVFYPAECTEAILAIEDFFDYELAYKDWLNIRAVECLRTPYDDLDLLLLKGKTNSTINGIGITSIDIAKLCVQYKAFRDLEAYRYRTIPDYVERTPMQFVHMHVLPNMLYSQLDNAIFNRLYAYTVGAPIGETILRHPFYLTDWSTRLDKILRSKIEYFEHNKLDFNTILSQVYLIDSFTLADFCLLPDLAKTRQVMWLLVLARLRQLIWLLKIQSSNKSNQDISAINRLKRFFTRVKRNNEIITQLPLAFKAVLDDELFDIYQLLDIH